MGLFQRLLLKRFWNNYAVVEHEEVVADSKTGTSFQYGKTSSEMNFLAGHCVCTVFSDLCTHWVVQLGLLVDIQSFAGKVNCVMLSTNDSTLAAPPPSLAMVLWTKRRLHTIVCRKHEIQSS